MRYAPRFFIVQEFVPPETFIENGQSSWRFISIDMVKIADFLREYFDTPIFINTWYSKQLINNVGFFEQSGFRTNESKIGSSRSAHKRGMAIDIKVKGISAQTVQEEIKNNYDKVFKKIGITGIELDTPIWTHLTNENWQSDDLKLISFYKKKAHE